MGPFLIGPIVATERKSASACLLARPTRGIKKFDALFRLK
jgi:hypothetical protein